MPQSTIANQYYEAERILDEKIMGEEIFYLIKWKGMDQNGKAWEPTWEPASHCTPPLIASWEQRSRAAKRKLKSPTIPSSPSNNSSKNSPNKRERKHQKTSGEFSYGTPPSNMGASAESPMIIDSDDDTSKNSSQNNSISFKLKLADDISSVGPTAAVKNVTIQRQLLHPYHILLPVPLSTLQQIAYRKTIDKPQFFKYLAETNLATPPELDSIMFQTKDQLLKIVNHLSLLLSSTPVVHLQGTTYQPFEKTGKLVMMHHLLNGLRNYDLTLGIAIPQGPIMNSIIKDFMKKHKFNYNILNETANKKLFKETPSSDDKLSCIVFTTPLPKMSEEELPQFDLVIAYDTSFNQKKHLLHTKTNENIPIIRLVTKNTLEHALNYQMLQQEDNFLFSDLSLFEMKRILTFGLWKKNQFVEAGCELTKFDIQGTCDKVFRWINGGMLRNLTFGMEAAVEKVWGKTIPPEHVTFDRSRLVGAGNNNNNSKERKDLASVRAEKRVSEVIDEGSLKKRKDKEVVQNEDDFQKKKKLKVTDESSAELSNTSETSKNNNKTLSLTTSEFPTILSPTEPLTESPIEINPMSLNKSKQAQSQKNSRDNSSRDSRRSSLKDSSKDSCNNKGRDSTQETIRDSLSSKNSIRENSNRSLSKDSNKSVKSISRDSSKSNKDQNKEQSIEENAQEWKQKYVDLFAQTKLQDEKIENLTQEKDKYLKMTNELSSELAKTRTQLGELQVKRKRTLLEAQSIELDKIRREMADVQLENSRLKSDVENKDQDIQKLRKEIESLKNNSKAMKTKIKNLEEYNLNNQQTRSSQSALNSKYSKRNESLEDQMQKFEEKISNLQLQCKLQEKELELAHEDKRYHQDITELLLQIKGKTKEEIEETYLAEKNVIQSNPTSTNTNTSVKEEVSNEIIVAPAIQNVPATNNNNNEESSELSINKTKNAFNGVSSSPSFKYFDSDLNELCGPPLASIINTTRTFTCNWDSCKKQFEKKEELKIHLKYDHNLDPMTNVIEIND